MSSESRYDNSYEQFVQDDPPSFDLFGDTFSASVPNGSLYNIPEDNAADSFFDDTAVSGQNQQFETMEDTIGNFEFGLSGEAQSSASNAYAPMNFAASPKGTGQWDFDAGDLRNQNDNLLAFGNPDEALRLGTSEITQTPLWDLDNASSFTELANPVGHKGRPGQEAGQSAVLHDVPAGHPSPTNFLRDVGKTWHGPQKCHWPNCSSNTTFPSRSSLNAHMKNIHVSPLLCTHTGCTYKRPFGKPCDLKRHVATKHDTEYQYLCAEGGCKEVFSRRDKMMQHAKEKHQLFKCSCNHCPATVVSEQRESHLQNSHGRFECAIGSCKSGRRSYFTKTNLKRHMRTCHGMTFDPISTMFHKLNLVGEEEVLYADAELKPTYRDCSSCLSSQHNMQ